MLAALLVGALIESPFAISMICALVVLTFALFWPLRGTGIDRIQIIIYGFLSVFFAFDAGLPNGINLAIGFKPDADAGIIRQLDPYVRWSSAFIIMMVAVCLISFTRHMFREHRSELVIRLSHLMLSAVAAASTAGWVFFPYVMKFVRAGMLSVNPMSALGSIAIIAVCILAAVIAVALIWLTARGYVESSRVKPDTSLIIVQSERIQWYERLSMQYGWVGAAMLPVMISGLLFFAIGFVFMAIAV